MWAEILKAVGSELPTTASVTMTGLRSKAVDATTFSHVRAVWHMRPSCSLSRMHRCDGHNEAYGRSCNALVGTWAVCVSEIRLRTGLSASRLSRSCYTLSYPSLFCAVATLLVCAVHRFYFNMQRFPLCALYPLACALLVL